MLLQNYAKVASGLVLLQNYAKVASGLVLLQNYAKVTSRLVLLQNSAKVPEPRRIAHQAVAGSPGAQSLVAARAVVGDYAPRAPICLASHRHDRRRMCAPAMRTQPPARHCNNRSASQELFRVDVHVPGDGSGDFASGGAHHASSAHGASESDAKLSVSMQYFSTLHAILREMQRCARKGTQHI